MVHPIIDTIDMAISPWFGIPHHQSSHFRMQAQVAHHLLTGSVTRKSWYTQDWACVNRTVCTAERSFCICAVCMRITANITLSSIAIHWTSVWVVAACGAGRFLTNSYIADVFDVSWVMPPTWWHQVPVITVEHLLIIEANGFLTNLNNLKL